MAAGSQVPGTPSAQRTGSEAVEKAARPPTPFSAGLGARKPRANVPRRAKERLGVHFRPAFGVHELPTSVKWSQRSAAEASML